jgi:hypothetical protein
MLDEAAHILSDQVDLLKSSARFVARINAGTPPVPDRERETEAVQSGR